MYGSGQWAQQGANAGGSWNNRGGMRGQMMGGMMGGGMMGGLNMGGLKMGGAGFINGPQAQPQDPMIERVNAIWEGNGSIARLSANTTQLTAIQGANGARLEEIKRMSQANIQTSKDKDSCLTQIKVSEGAGGVISVKNAVWLIEICLNAYCKPDVSLAPFDPKRPLEEAVMSNRFGTPPGLNEGPPSIPPKAESAGQWQSGF